MRTHSSTVSPPATKLAPSRSGVLALSGYGLSIAVERGHLVVSDGIGAERRQARLARATSKLKRLVVLGHTGSVTLEAVRWLHDIGAAFVQIDRDGEVLLASGPMGLDDARLRRAQALAPFNGVGLSIARELLHDKLQGQRRVLEQLPDPDQAQAVIAQAIDSLATAEGPEQLRILEASAAAAYWGAWSAVSIQFARKDLARIPEHWRTFGARVSPITGAPRKAGNPANALLNYLYAILEAETRIAALTMGLDPGMGVLHADQSNRDSLACDLMEVVRPRVDAYVLNLLRTHTFTGRDFFETPNGVCRILPPVTRLLAETAPTWAHAVAPVVEQVAQRLHQGRPALIDRVGKSQSGHAARPPARSARLPTPLTQSRRSAGRDRVRRNPKPAITSTTLTLLPTCPICGIDLESRDRQYCDDCLPERRAEGLAAFQVAGPATLARERASGIDSSHTETAQAKRGATQMARARTRAEWNAQAQGTPPQDVAWPDVLAGLASVSLGAMRRATGLSLTYCAQIKKGQRVPHPSYWAPLAALTS